MVDSKIGVNLSKKIDKHWQNEEKLDLISKKKIFFIFTKKSTKPKELELCYKNLLNTTNFKEACEEKEIIKNKQSMITFQNKKHERW